MFKVFVIFHIFFVSSICSTDLNLNTSKYSDVYYESDRMLKPLQNTNIPKPYDTVEYFEKTKWWPDDFNRTLFSIGLPFYFQTTVKFTNVRDGVNNILDYLRLDTNIFCQACYAFANYMFQQIRNGLERKKILNEMTEICDMLNIETERVCRGFLELNLDTFISIIMKNENLEGQETCQLVFQEACGPLNATWVVDIPGGQSPTRKKPTGKKTLLIVHVSDFHFDPLYTQNKEKICKEPICCQIDQNDGNEADNNICGYYGEYGNDASENLVDEVIEFINSMPYDYIYFTGDIVSHRVWSTSPENNSASIETIFRKLGDFPRTTFPVLGNHEPSPLNTYNFLNSSYANVSTQWLYTLVEKQWDIWLPKSAKETIAKGGYYTVSPLDGFRIIVLNSNVAYTLNWWLLESNEDPYGQLEWLAETLLEAEKKNESVHILSHIPSGSGDVFYKWSEQYYKIINRFASIIKGQFNGHTHMDQFTLYFAESNYSEPINVAWNGASVAPFNSGNPSFKVYTVDAETFDILEIDEWTFNLTLSNQHYYEFPEWYQLYSFKTAYNLSSLELSDINDLVIRMAQNNQLLIDYHRYRYRNSDLADVCDDTCQKDHLCEIVQFLTLDKSKCSELLEVSNRFAEDDSDKNGVY